MLRNAFLTSTALGLSLFAPASVLADDVIDIPAQPLGAALTELANETGLQVTATANAIEGKTSSAVSGVMAPQAALKQMLSDTGLSFRVPEKNGAILSFTDPASQNANDEPFFLGTIILTGERVERDIFSTATSVEAVDGQEIEANPQNNDVESVFQDVANITTGTGNTAPHIRGVNSAGEISGGALGGVAGSLPRATVTIDGRNLTPNETIYGTTSVYDTEVIEVFRGPQTTSQGANAIAGAFNVRTRDPVFETEASIRAEVASENGRAFSLMANTPISDSLAARLVYDFEEQDYYFDYAPGVAALPEGRSQRQETVRFKILWEPVTIPSLSTQLTFGYSEFSAAQNQSLRLPFSDLISFDTLAPPVFIGNTRSVVHDVEYDFGGGWVLKNQFQYSVGESLRTLGLGAFTDFPQKLVDRSNETILEYAPEGGNFSGIIGFYIRETVETSPGSVAFNLEGERSGYGIFGEFTRKFGDAFDVTAGLRYQSNEQQRVVTPFGFPVAIANFDGDFDAWLPKLTVGYEPSENTRFAFQISRGYNPGGFAVILTTLAPYQYASETVTNLELSVRHRSDDGRLFLGANLFYSDYSDYQLFVSQIVAPTGPLGTTQAGRLFNVSDVKTFGLEVNGQYQLTDALRLDGSLGLLHTDVGDLGAQIAAFTGSTANNGNELPFAPNITLSLGLEYDVNDRLSIGGKVNYTGSYFTDANNNPAVEAGNFAIFDLTASYQLSDRAEIYGYVNNVFDKRGETSLFISGTGASGGSITPPREIGLGVRATF